MAAALALSALLLAPPLARATGSQASGQAVTVAEVEAAFVARVNEEREARGRSLLASEEDLAAVGREHSADMAGEGSVYHNPLLAEQVQDWEVVGENVGTGGSVDDIHMALMGSTQHRDVILDPRFDGVGVGVVEVDDRFWVTQVFRQRAFVVRAAEASSPPEEPVPETAPPQTAPPGDTLPPDTSPPATPDSSPANLRPATTAPASLGPAPVVAVRPPPGTTATAVTSAVPEAPAPTDPAPSTPVPPPTTSDEGGQAVAAPVAAIPLPIRPELPAAGLLAAFLLWTVVAGLAGVTVRRRPRLG